MRKAISIEPGAIWFQPATGERVNLLTDRLLTPRQAASVFGRSTRWVLNKVAAKELTPALRQNGRIGYVFACAVREYLARSV